MVGPAGPCRYMQVHAGDCLLVEVGACCWSYMLGPVCTSIDSGLAHFWGSCQIGPVMHIYARDDLRKIL